MLKKVFPLENWRHLLLILRNQLLRGSGSKQEFIHIHLEMFLTFCEHLQHIVMPIVAQKHGRWR